MIEQRIKSTVRDIADFPKPGIIFKDITPILKDAALCNEIVDAFVEQLGTERIDVVAGIESRGFLFGLMLANRLNVPFVPIRKAGRLPYKTIQQSYDLEYGFATIEIHEDAFAPGTHVLIHDDLLATGGTLEAAALLVEKLGAKVSGFAFVIGLEFLNGRDKLTPFSDRVVSLASY